MAAMTRRNRTPILVLCCAAQFIGLLDITIVNVALPSIRADLGFSTAGLHWVVNAYTLALAGFLLLGGRAADLIGRREVFAGGLALFGLASLIGGLAQDEATLVAARVGQGLGGAVVAPTGLSILTTTFAAGAERNRAFAWWGTLGGLGGATGALVGGLLTEMLSWRWVLLINAPICLGAALAAVRVVPALPRPPGLARSFDLRGALSVTAGLVLLTFGIVNTERHGLTAAATLGPLAAGGALLGLFALIEGRLAAAPLVPLRIFRSRALSCANVVVLCLGAVTFSMWFLVTLYLQQVLGLSALQAGLAFVPMSLTIVASTRLGSRLATRVGPGPVMAAGMAVLATGMLLFSRIDADGSWARDLLAPSLLCAAGIGCSFVPSTIAATSAVAGQDSGLASGLLNTSYQVGSSLGLALLATIASGETATVPDAAALTEGFRHAFVAGGCLALAGSLVALLVLARGRLLLFTLWLTIRSRLCRIRSAAASSSASPQVRRRSATPPAGSASPSPPSPST
jgi:EmrB/QacA subfamily drug resistance transporter